MLVLGTSLVGLPTNAYHTAYELHALQTTTSPTNVHLVCFPATDIRHDLGHDVYHGDLVRTSLTQTELVRGLWDIAGIHEQLRRQNDFGTTILKVNDPLVKKSIGAGTILAAETGGGSLMVPALGFVAWADLCSLTCDLPSSDHRA